MPIALVQGENFRLYRKFEIRPHPTLNLIVGDNAAGKTTLLEALFVAGRGRSFRATSLNELSGSDGRGWTMFMQVAGENDRRIGIGWNREGLQTRMDEERGARLSDIVRAIPMQILDPQAHRLLDEGPTYRRSFVDWECSTWNIASWMFGADTSVRCVNAMGHYARNRKIGRFRHGTKSCRVLVRNSLRCVRIT